MDAAGLAITVAGSVLKLVAFSADFIADAKQVYRKGGTDRNLDLAMVTRDIQSAIKSLGSQLDDFGNRRETGDPDPLEEVSKSTHPSYALTASDITVYRNRVRLTLK